jgi:hypothetical protein
LPKLTSLKNRYASLREFFVSQLAITNATASDVVDGLVNLDGQEKHRDAIKELLVELNDHVKRNRVLKTTLERFKRSQLKIYPIRSNSTELLGSASIVSDWFINGRERLGRCFEGHVALFDFNPHEVKVLEHLLVTLGLSHRKLSSSFSEETEAVGESTYHVQLTDQLRSKASYIARYGVNFDFTRLCVRITNDN